jgi:uroporphyrinogen-III synthase
MSVGNIVYVIGAGPGAKDLLTLRAAELLRRAEIVASDLAVSDEVLSWAPRTAQVTRANPAGTGVVSQLETWVAQAKAGRCVIRLVTGDPRWRQDVAREIQAIRQAGVVCEILPGIALEPLAGNGPMPSSHRRGSPLAGARIVVTRAREQAGAFSDRLREQGAEVLEVPVIKFAPPDDKESLRDALLGLHEYDWLVFTSVNGVDAFFGYFFQAFPDLRDLGGVRLAAVGPATAARLKELHLTVNAMPAEALGKKVARAMAEHGSLENLRVCLLRAQKAAAELPKLLEAEGAIVDDVACYKTTLETEDPEGVAARLQASGADWITFTSASTVEHFHTRFNLPELLGKFPGLRTASIGPETTQALLALSLQPDVEAKEHTTEGLMKAMGRAGRSPRTGGT